jgi:hypothetical protein
MEHKDGSMTHYTGEIKNFQMNGQGILRKHGFIKYEGNFKEGKIQGLGKYFLDYN